MSVGHSRQSVDQPWAWYCQTHCRAGGERRGRREKERGYREWVERAVEGERERMEKGES